MDTIVTLNSKNITGLPEEILLLILNFLSISNLYMLRCVSCLFKKLVKKLPVEININYLRLSSYPLNNIITLFDLFTNTRSVIICFEDFFINTCIDCDHIDIQKTIMKDIIIKILNLEKLENLYLYLTYNDKEMIKEIIEKSQSFIPKMKKLDLSWGMQDSDDLTRDVFGICNGLFNKFENLSWLSISGLDFTKDNMKLLHKYFPKLQSLEVGYMVDSSCIEYICNNWTNLIEINFQNDPQRDNDFDFKIQDHLAKIMECLPNLSTLSFVASSNIDGDKHFFESGLNNLEIHFSYYINSFKIINIPKIFVKCKNLKKFTIKLGRRKKISDLCNLSEIEDLTDQQRSCIKWIEESWFLQ